MKLVLIALAAAAVFGSEVEGLKCHTCAFYDHEPEGGIPEDDKKIVHSSCQEGNIPEQQFIQGCGAGEQTCVKFTVKTEAYSVLYRKCHKSVPEFGENCTQYTFGDLEETPEPSDALKEFVAGLKDRVSDSKTPVNVCSCKHNQCLFMYDSGTSSVYTTGTNLVPTLMAIKILYSFLCI